MLREIAAGLAVHFLGGFGGGGYGLLKKPSPKCLKSARTEGRGGEKVQ